jgi:hypothetical protein
MRQIHRLMIGLTSVALLGCWASRAQSADDPEIAVEVSATEVFSGESVDYVVDVRNVQNPSAPDLTAVRRDFNVVATGDESHNQSSIFIINGRKTEETVFGHIFRFRLTPKRTGRLTIPAPTVTVDGETVSGRALSLNVIAPEPQDLVVSEIQLDRNKLYPTQPFEVTLRVFIRPLPDDPERDPLSPLRRRPPHIDTNWVDLPAGLSGDEKSHWLEKFLAENGSGFTLNDLATRSGSFFGGAQAAVFNLYHGRESRKGLDGQPVNYFVYELKRRITAEKTGTYLLGPALVKGSFVDERDGNSYSARRLVAVAPAISLEVKQVPTPRPATFCGGIGDYNLAASASPTSLRVGDPLTLTLAVERGKSSGSLDLISAPDLSANSQIAADFEVVDKNPTGRKEGNVKRFEYALRPKRAGVGVPSVAVTVFNPDTEGFAEVATSPIALDVSAASRVDAGDLVGSLGGQGTSEIKSQAQGIYQNVTDLSELRDERVSLVALAGVVAGVWCGVGCLIGVVGAHRRKSGDVVWQRRRHARRTAERKLAEARALLADGRSTDALRAARSAVVGLIADMRNIVAEGLTASEADAALAQTALPPGERAAVSRLLESIELAEYGSGARSEAPAMIETATELIPSLARHLARDA